MKQTKVSNTEIIPALKNCIILNSQLPLGEGKQVSRENAEKRNELNSNLKTIKEAFERRYIDKFVKYSSGMGTKGEVPWIMISNPGVSINATYGYYVVVLFSGIEKAFTISLAYAWTQVAKKGSGKKGISKLIEFKKIVRDWITSSHDAPVFSKKYAIDTPQLGYTSRTLGYQAGSIFTAHIKYEETQTFDVFGAIDDLIEIYDYIYERKLGGLTLDSTDFSNVSNISAFQNALSDSKINWIKSIDYSKIKFENIDNKAKNANVRLGNSYEKTPYVISREKFNEVLEKKQVIGDQGEDIVVEFERYQLASQSQNELWTKVTKLDTNGTGYDVLSYEDDGKEKFIEVKSFSTLSKVVTIFITSNEIDRAKEISEKGLNYYLYIVQNVSVGKEPKISYFKNPFGDLKNYITQNPAIELLATQYKFRIKIEN